LIICQHIGREKEHAFSWSMRSRRKDDERITFVDGTYRCLRLARRMRIGKTGRYYAHKYEGRKDVPMGVFVMVVGGKECLLLSTTVFLYKGPFHASTYHKGGAIRIKAKWTVVA